MALGPREGRAEGRGGGACTRRATSCSTFMQRCCQMKLTWLPQQQRIRPLLHGSPPHAIHPSFCQIMGLKGGLLKDEADMAALGIKPGQKVSMMGTAEAAPEAPKTAQVSACSAGRRRGGGCWLQARRRPARWAQRRGRPRLRSLRRCAWMLMCWLEACDRHDGLGSGAHPGRLERLWVWVQI